MIDVFDSLNPVARHRARCRQVRALMSEYLDGELALRDSRRLERHLRWCPNCRRMLESLRRTIGGLNRLAGGDAAPRCEGR